MQPSTRSPLDSLRLPAVLAPMTVGEFNRAYRDERHLHLPAAVPRDGIDALLSLRSFDAVVSSGRLAHPQLETIRDERPAAAATGVRGRVSGLQLAQAVADGASLRMRSVQDHVDGVAVACATLADDLDENVDATAYYTPGGTHAFRPHFDDHDVFVVQCHGRKIWRIWESYENGRALPLPGEGFDPALHVPGAVADELTLDVGDVLYVPRGVMHAARCDEGDSLHITFSTSTTTLGDLLLEYCRALTREDPVFRRKLHHVALTRPLAAGGAMDHFRAANVLTSVDPDMLTAAAGAVLSKFTTSVAPARTGGAFVSQASGDDATDEYIYDPTVVWRALQTADGVELHLPEHESELTEGEYAALRAVKACDGPVRAQDLAGRFPDLNMPEFLAELAGIGVLKRA